jgi:hypothetical protein
VKPLLRLLRAAATVAAPALGAPLLRLYGMTGRVRLVGLESLARGQAAPEPLIYAFWHDQLLAMLVFLHGRARRLGVLSSLHPDSEPGARANARLGLDVIRGSSTRGGAEAFGELVKYLRGGGSLVWMPDGPKGPRHRASEGVLVLAQRAGARIVPAACAVAPRFRIRSWDRMQIPAPFARMTALGGEPLAVPEAAGREERDALRLELERRLEALTLRAEAAR